MAGHGDGEDVLHPLTVYLHAQAREGVRLYRRGRLDLGLKDDRPSRQAHQHVRALPFVQRLGHGR